MAESSASSDRVAELKRKMQEAAAKRAAEQAAKEQAAAAPAATPSLTTPVDAAAEEAAARNAATVEAERSPVAEAVASADVAVEAPAGGTLAQASGTESQASGTVAQADSVVEEASAIPDAGNQQVAEALAQAETAATAEASAVAVADPAASSDAAPIASPAAVSTQPSPNGASGSVHDELPKELSPEEREQREMTRRELLTYAWGGALGLVGLASGVGLFLFMYPRFRAGEFGGEFFVPTSEIPATDAGPTAFSSGKFWLVQSETEGAKALYMVCTHLGCLYKWEASNFRFECPCHGSKFSKDGFYIEGPAPRSLDRFETRVDGETLVVDTGAKITGSPSSESPDRAAA